MRGGRTKHGAPLGVPFTGKENGKGTFVALTTEIDTAVAVLVVFMKAQQVTFPPVTVTGPLTVGRQVSA